MKRVIIKVGDVFSVQIDEQFKKYFQYIANDLTQLNSSVIRAFKTRYSKIDTPDLVNVVKDEVEFYAHCFIRNGTKMGFWEKVGSVKEVGSLDLVFRDTMDYGIKAGEQPVKVSYNWRVWKINDPTFTQVGKLEGEHRKAEIGLVFNPLDIIHRMKHGEYMGSYPGFE